MVLFIEYSSNKSTCSCLLMVLDKKTTASDSYWSDNKVYPLPENNFSTLSDT